VPAGGGDHHDGDCFRNPWVDGAEFGTGKLPAVAQFMWLSCTQQARLPSKAELGRLFPLMPTDWPAVRDPDPSACTVTWIGHASFLVSVGGATFLTDPVFSSRASPVPFAGPWRYAPLPFGVDRLPKIDFVVISHSHYDHLDLPSVLQLAEHSNPLWLVGLRLGDWFREQGVERVQELDWWQSVEVGTEACKVTVTATPCQHWSARTPFDRMKTLWCSWHVQGREASFFFAGDTALCPAFQEIRSRLGAPTVAAIPVGINPSACRHAFAEIYQPGQPDQPQQGAQIGAYLPRAFMRHHHASPEDAVQIHQDLGAQWSVGCHWGTLRQKALEHVMQPPRDLKAELNRRCDVRTARRPVCDVCVCVFS